MKKLVYSLMAAAAAVSTAVAGPVYSPKQPIEPLPPAPAPSLFADEEISFDIFGLRTFTRSGGGETGYKDSWGGGVGVNFFFARYFGLGVDGYWANMERGGNVVSSVSGSAILRVPIDLDGFGIAPYMYGGGGGHFDSINQGSGHAGAGVEFRFTPNMGIFTDGRYVWTATTNDFGMVRSGFRFTF